MKVPDSPVEALKYLGRKARLGGTAGEVHRESHPKRRKSAVGPEPELDSEIKKRLEDRGYYQVGG